MSIDEQLKAAYNNYLRAGATIANVIQAQERDLERMKSKGIAQEFIDAKDSEIQGIVNYHNQVDELIQFYRLQNINLKIQLSEACEFVVKSAVSDISKTQYLLKYLTLNSDGQNNTTKGN